MTLANATPAKARGMMKFWSIVNGWFYLVWFLGDSSSERGSLCVLVAIRESKSIGMVE